MLAAPILSEAGYYDEVHEARIASGVYVRSDQVAGEAIGRDIGAKVVAWSAGDGVGLTDPGVPPVGPGKWISPGTIARGLLGARPFFLSSDDEFRPGPPPAFGSAAFLAALAEVRQISETRTQEQLASALFW